MANQNALNAIKKGLPYVVEWMQKSHEDEFDLSNANLQNMDLRWINFAGVNLENADLRGAILTGSYFGPSEFHKEKGQDSRIVKPADLRGAKFDRATLFASTFNFALLANTSFDNSYMALANFRGIDFKFISLEGCRLLNTGFFGCKLDNAIGLDTITHLGPSYIDFDTVIQSPKLSKLFLKQIGIPESIADYIPSFVHSISAIELYSCFISHATPDKEFCDLLYSRMIKEGYRVWYAPEDMKGGEKVWDQIESAIKISDKLILVLSEHSIHSNWVINEIKKSLAKEKLLQQKVLFPISLVPYSSLQNWELIDDKGNDLASEIRSYYIPDFEHWRRNSFFENSFQKLLKDLSKINDVKKI